MALMDPGTDATWGEVALARRLQIPDATVTIDCLLAARVGEARLLARRNDKDQPETSGSGGRPRGQAARQLIYWDEGRGLTWGMLQRRLAETTGRRDAIETLRRQLSGDGSHTTPVALLDALPAVLETPTSFLGSEFDSPLWLLEFVIDAELAAVVELKALHAVVLAMRLDNVRQLLVHDPQRAKGLLRKFALSARRMAAQLPPLPEAPDVVHEAAEGRMLTARLGWPLGLDASLPPFTAAQRHTIWDALSQIRHDGMERALIEAGVYQPTQAERNLLPQWELGRGLTVSMLCRRIEPVLPKDHRFEVTVDTLTRQLTEADSRRLLTLAIVKSICVQAKLELADLYGEQWRRPPWLVDFQHTIRLFHDLAPDELRAVLQAAEPIRAGYNYLLLACLAIGGRASAERSLLALADQLNRAWVGSGTTS